MAKKRFRRRRKVIRPGFQMTVVGIFVATVCIGLVAFAAQMFEGIDRAISDMAHAGLQDHLFQLTITTLIYTLALSIALTTAVAIAVSFRVAGPIYRMGKFLEQIKNGENPGPCSLRKGDVFHDFCTLLNEVTEPRVCIGIRHDVQPDTPD